MKDDMFDKYYLYLINSILLKLKYICLLFGYIYTHPNILKFRGRKSLESFYSIK